MLHTVSDIYHAERKHPLDAIFNPKSVAVVGATETEGAVGRTLLWNLVTNPFGGTVYPVNPKRPSVLGVRAYPSIADLPETPDLAVIATPAKTVPPIIEQCVQRGVGGAIIISAGFREVGEEGIKLEQQVREFAAGRMRIVGPNCLGVMNPVSGFNATFAAGMARAGNIAFVSQSGALCTAVLDWSLREQIGFSAFISIGSMMDVGWGDLISYLGDDPRTQSIVIYMESVGHARAFLSAAREVALSKPIIVIKAGRSAEAASAAASHTGTLAGSDDVLDAAFRRVGVLRVDRISDLFNLSEILARQPRPKGPNLTIVTNAGGPGVLATDALIEGGGKLTTIGDDAMGKLNDFLPAAWSHGNPIDVLGDAKPDRYAKTLEIAAHDENADGLLVVLTPQDMTEPTQTAEALRPYAKIHGKPVLASWMGGPSVGGGVDILNAAGIPTFNSPDDAARAFCYMWQYTHNLRALYETPALPPADAPGIDREAATAIIETARSAGRTLLTEFESKQLLAAYGLPTVATELANNPDAAVTAADGIGYPVVLKLHSYTVTHKTDVGGVKLSLRDADAVRAAFAEIQQSVTDHAGADAFDGVTVQKMARLDGYELIVGSSIDPQFGPVLLFGAGGTLVEVFKDRALGLPPLNGTLARRLIERTKIAKALAGTRGRPPVDREALEFTLVRFSQLIAEQPWIAECDLNPLLASEHGIVALDARVLLHPEEMDEAKLPALAVRPYPTQYVERWKMTDGSPVTIRPIRPEDEPAMIAFHESLGEDTVRLRFFQQLKLSTRVAHERLSRVCFNDYDREIALVAEQRNHGGDAPPIVAVARLSRLDVGSGRGEGRAEFALLVTDSAQRKGLGTHLLRKLLRIARAEGVSRVEAQMLSTNSGMEKVCRKLGFTLAEDREERTLHAVIELTDDD